MKRLILLALISLVVAAPAHAQFFKKGLFRKRVEQADSIPGMRSIYEVFNLVHSQYVTDPNTQKLSEEAIRSTLRSLDPHSIYIPAREVGRTNEALQGNFVGVGISYLVINDTVCVQEVIAGGPAEKVGMPQATASSEWMATALRVTAPLRVSSSAISAENGAPPLWPTSCVAATHSPSPSSATIFPSILSKSFLWRTTLSVTSTSCALPPHL